MAATRSHNGTWELTFGVCVGDHTTGTGIYLLPIPASLADDDTFVLEWMMTKQAVGVICLEDDIEYCYQVSRRE